jgi:uncharacterized protein (UPF0332 family)
MRKLDFLNKLKKEGKLRLVDSSEDICDSYLEKADNSFKAAKILLKNDLYENSVSMSYYAMYNSLTALFFRVGIKSENHSASIILLEELFHRTDLYKTISFAKKERIDKQYYVDFTLKKQSAKDLLGKAEDFLIQIKLIIKNIKNEEMDKVRTEFSHLLK